MSKKIFNRVIKNVTYFFKRKIHQIKKLIKWVPVIWKSYDFDYECALEVFKLKLSEIADYLESQRAWTQGNKIKAGKIRTVLKLMDKVYDEEYQHEYLDKVKEKYGVDILDLEFIDIPGTEYSEIKNKYELTMSSEKIKEIDEFKSKLFIKSMKKQEKAHRILWALVEHNIQGWWD